MRFFLKVLFPLILIFSAAAGYYAYQQFSAFKLSTVKQDNQVFEIAKGSTIGSVSKQLAQKNIISSPLYFKWLAKLNKQASKIKAGEYQIKKGMTPDDLLSLFVKGATLQYQTRLPEGKTFNELVSIIQSDKHLKQTLSDEDYNHIMQKLDTDYSQYKPEGWFFPDTYSYPRNTTDLQFLQRAHNAMVKKLKAGWAEREPFKGIDSLYDALILASIIEKETGDPRDRKKVARVFINRLEKNMLLQTDPTVIYGMGKAYKGNIRKKDLKKDTPFNTYTRKGLPPTPITTPSAASIDAVFHPDNDNKILYFVAKGDGLSHFSENYKAHKKAVVKYLLNGDSSRYQGDK